MKMTRGIFLLLLCLSIVLAFAGCGSAPGENPSGKGPAKTDVFRVGMECAYAPFNWTQTDASGGAVAIEGGGYAGGYDVEIAKRIAEGLDKELVIVKTDWEGLTPALTSGKIDAIVAGMSPTAERAMTIDFSDYYYDSDLVVVVRGDSPLANAKSIGDFSGAKITAQLNTFHYTVLDQMSGMDKQTALEDFPTMVIALSSGKIDGYVSEKPGAISAVKANPNLTFVEFESGNGFSYEKNDVSISVGLKKNSELTASINDILSGISEDERQSLMDNAVATQPDAE